MVDCAVLPKNSLMVFKGETPVTEAYVADTLDIHVYFPDYYAGYEYKLFDTKIGKLTETILLLDDNGCGKFTAQFTEGTYNLHAQVCGIWYGDNCLSLISSSNVSNAVTLSIVPPPEVPEGEQPPEKPPVIPEDYKKYIPWIVGGYAVLYLLWKK